MKITASLAVSKARQETSAPPIGGRRASPCRILPLRFGRQAIDLAARSAEPGQIVVNVVPAYIADGLVVIAVRRERTALTVQAFTPLTIRDRGAAQSERGHGNVVDRSGVPVLRVTHLERAASQPHHLRAALAVPEGRRVRRRRGPRRWSRGLQRGRVGSTRRRRRRKSGNECGHFRSFISTRGLSRSRISGCARESRRTAPLRPGSVAEANAKGHQACYQDKRSGKKKPSRAPVCSPKRRRIRQYSIHANRIGNIFELFVPK